MSSALGQHRLLRLSPQWLELIQLFIQPRDTFADSGFRQPLQTTLPLFWLVDSAKTAQDNPGLGKCRSLGRASSPGDLHPEALTEPCLSLSAHTALAIQES